MSIGSSTLRVFVFAAAALAVALAFPRRAFAGTLQIQDEAHVLKVADAERLRSVVADAPFDARLVFTAEYTDPQDLSRFVGSRVNEPNLVAVGVDPVHRHVQVHFGRGSGIAPSAWSTVERAGNGAFRDGDWAGGAAAIFRMASQSVTAGAPGTTQPIREPSSGIGSGLLLLLLLGGGVAAMAFFAWRRSRYGTVNGPGYGSGPYGGGPYGGAPYGAPPPGGMGPLGGGLIGAGLGGLAGYELGKLEGEREERDRGFDDRPAPSDDNYDAGGGGSSWDGGSDDGGGGDGGGSDIGGGDTGGGGSDF